MDPRDLDGRKFRLILETIWDGKNRTKFSTCDDYEDEEGAKNLGIAIVDALSAASGYKAYYILAEALWWIAEVEDHLPEEIRHMTKLAGDFFKRRDEEIEAASKKK
jgi:hypothetical protein